MPHYNDVYTTRDTVEPMADKPAEETLPDIVDMLVKRITVLEEKLNTYQGMDTLAVEIESRIVRRIRNTIGRNTL